MSPKELSGRVAPLTVACGVAFLQFVGAYMRIPLVPLYAKSHGATAADVGMIVGLFMLTAACMAIPVGYLSDRVGRRVVIAAGVGIGVLVSAALPSTEHLRALMALYAAAGVGVAAFTPAMMAYIADAAPPAMMGRAYGWYTTAQYAGIAVGPALGGLIAGPGEYSRAFLGSAAVLAIALIGVVVALPARGPRAVSVSGHQMGVALHTILKQQTILACWAAVFTATFVWGAFLSFFPLYAQDAGLSPTAIGVCFTVQAVANTLGRAPVGRAIDRGGSRLPFIAGGMAVLSLATAGVILARTPLGLGAASALQGLAMGVSMVAVGAALAEATTTESRGLAMGGYGTAIYLGMAVSAWVLGPVILHGGYATGFLTAGAVGVAGTVATLLLLATPSRGRSYGSGLKRERGQS